jgi:RND family efflux transporter MFP subunit
MKKMIGVVLLVVLVAALAGAGYWYYDSRTASASAVGSGTSLTQVVTVERGNLSATLSLVGSLEAVQSADLAFTEMSGTAALLSLDVHAGQAVTAGQVLASIDAASYELALEQARSDLEAAEEALAGLTTPPAALEIAQADVAVAAAQVDVQAAQNTLYDLQNPDIADLETAVADARVALAQSRVELLALEQDTSEDDKIARLREADADAYAIYTDFANKVHSETDVEYHVQLMLLHNQVMDAQDALVNAEVEARLGLLRAQIAVRNNEQALAEAREALAEAQAGGDKLALAQAELAVHKAEVALQLAQEARAELEEEAAATDVAAARAAVEKQRLAVSDAEAALAGTQLVAPFDGTVLEIHVSAGDPVAASTPIATLADLDSFQVMASVDETTIRQVSAGQGAAITFDAYPDQVSDGEVLSVPLRGTLQGGVTVYEVPLSLVGTKALNLLVGMTANVEIQVGQATDALLVPAMALVKAGGGYQVLVPNTADPVAGEPEAVPVQVGLSDGTYTQVLKGLNVGDQVLVELDTGSDETFLFGRMEGGGGIMGGPGGGNLPAMPGSGLRP